MKRDWENQKVFFVVVVGWFLLQISYVVLKILHGASAVFKTKCMADVTSWSQLISPPPYQNKLFHSFVFLSAEVIIKPSTCN